MHTNKQNNTFEWSSWLAPGAKWGAATLLTAALVACGGGGDGGGGSASSSSGSNTNSGSAAGLPTVSAPKDEVQSGSSSGQSQGSGQGSQTALKPIAGQVIGYITYDSVPVTASSGLDYVSTQQRPVREALVELVDGSTVLASGMTNSNGYYALPVPAGRAVVVRVQARMSSSDGRWDVAVRDNTGSGYPQAAPVYAMSSSKQTIGTEGAVLDLNAASGWTGSSYGAPRAAAPFSILDQTYASMQYMRGLQPALAFPALNIFWSVNNRSASGNFSDGDIGSSNWSSAYGNVSEGIYVLGKENSDSDEYDASVLSHEWLHYFEHKLGRSDSIGGSHAFGEKMDMRVAWSEGMASGLSAAMRGSATFVDSKGYMQSLSSQFAVNEVPPADDKGFYSERSVQYLTYQLMQMGSGPAAVLATLLNEQKNTASATSVFSFVDGLRTRLSGSAVEGLLNQVGLPAMNAIDAWGGPVSYDSLFAASIPVTSRLATGSVVPMMCVSNAYGSYNHLDRYRPVRIDVPVAGRYRFAADGYAGANARVDIYQQGQWQAPWTENLQGNKLASTYELKAGTYMAMLTDADMYSGKVSAKRQSCFAVRWELLP